MLQVAPRKTTKRKLETFPNRSKDFRNLKWYISSFGNSNIFFGGQQKSLCQAPEREAP